MASLEQHTSDSVRFLGEPFENVNRWMDEFFARYGPLHRKVRHHREGIEEAREIFGDRAALAAAIHILRDCRHIPRKQDYELGYADALGLKRNWSTAAYIKYSEGDFESVVEQLLRPSGIVLWSFVDSDAVQFLLQSFTALASDDIQAALPKLPTATEKRNSLSPLKTIDPGLITREAASPEVLGYLEEVKRSPLFTSISSIQEATLAFVPIDQLVTPLVCIDYEYLDSLKPELSGLEDVQLARFALPQTLATQVKAVAEPTQRNWTFVSNQKTLTVSPARVRQTSQGTEVTFLVAANWSLILVANYSGRLILRNGIHRAFLLAKMGMKTVPCVLVNEVGDLPNIHNTTYPSFAPQMLIQPRPPLLVDFLDPELCLQVPLQRTHKVIRIAAEELVIPVD
jgi:hypothetical protein